MIELSGLWISKKKDGEVYFTGSLGRTRLVIFKNGFKKDEKEPDYLLYVDERQKKFETSDTKDDDIPF